MRLLNTPPSFVISTTDLLLVKFVSEDDPVIRHMLSVISRSIMPEFSVSEQEEKLIAELEKMVDQYEAALQNKEEK